MPTIEELQLQVLELEEAVKERDTTIEANKDRIRSLEETNSKLYNKVVVSHKEEPQNKKETISLEDFVNKKLGGK